MRFYLFEHNFQNVLDIKQTLDNPIVLEQQLEALEYHKKVMERREQYQKMIKEGTFPRKLLSEPTASSITRKIEENKQSSQVVNDSLDTAKYDGGHNDGNHYCLCYS